MRGVLCTVDLYCTVEDPTAVSISVFMIGHARVAVLQQYADCMTSTQYSCRILDHMAKEEISMNCFDVQDPLEFAHRGASTKPAN